MKKFGEAAQRVSSPVPNAAQSSVVVKRRPNEPHVLFYYRDRVALERWAKAARDVAHVAAAEDSDALERLLLTTEVDAIVCAWEPEIVDRVHRLRRGIRIIHCDVRLPAEALRAIAEGYDFSHAGTEAELMMELEKLERRERGSVVRKAASGFTVRVGDGAREFPVADLSNHGIAFFVESRDGIDAFLPGSLIENVRVGQEGNVGLEVSRAIVRHTSVDGTRYRVGCQLQIVPKDARSERSTVIRDRAQIGGMFTAALATHGVRLASAGEQSVELDCSAGEVDFEGQSFRAIDVLLHGFQDFDIVRGSFDRLGRLYRFDTVCVKTSPLTFRLPQQIVETEQRAVERCRPPLDAPIEVTLESLLIESPLTVTAFDVSTGGFSFDFERAEGRVFPLGLMFRRLEVRLGDKTVACRGQVRTVSCIAGERDRLRCGVAFVDITDANRAAVASYVTEQLVPGLHDNPDLSFDEVMTLFRSAGFMPEEKELMLTPMMPEVRRTYECLQKAQKHLHRAFVAYDEDQAIGYMDGLRMYSNTMLGHHFAAVKGKKLGGSLLMGLLAQLLHDTDAEYLRGWFIVGNHVPERVFGNFGRMVTDERLCDLRELRHVIVPTDRDVVGGEDLRVMEAHGEDLDRVERYFFTNEKAIMIQAEDLTRHRMALSQVNEMYQTIGLYRRRQVLIAWERNVPLGFALLELSSPGMNLSEGLTSFRLFFWDEAKERQVAVTAALVRAVQTSLRLAGRRTAFGLLRPEQGELAQAIGAHIGPLSRCLTVHRSRFRLFSEHTRQVDVRRKRDS